MLRLNSPKQLWRRYVVALAIVLALLGVSHAASIMALKGSAEATRVINIAGRQNMLSQKILYFVARSRLQGDAASEPDPRLATAIDEFEAAHVALSQGGALGLSVEGAAERAPAYGMAIDGLTLDWLSRRFIGDARRILNQTPDSAHAWRRMEMMGPALLLRRLDAAVALFEQSMQDRTARVETVARMSFIFAILVVAGEALFIFLPAQRAVDTAIDALERTNRDLEAARSTAETLYLSEKSARELAERAREAQMRFLSYISHELRTPLNGVIGMLTLMGDERSGRERDEHVRLARDASDQLMSIVGNVLDMSKLEAGQMRVATAPFDIRETTLAAVSVMTPRARINELRLETAIAPALPELLIGDPGRLRQILTNLIGNAITYTDAGSVTVHADYDPARDGGTLILRVVDTGPGIAAEDQAALFEPFRQSGGSDGRQQSGTGLGLTICKQFVELMKGRIGIDSRPGHGSCFWVEIPCPAGTLGLPAGDERPAAPDETPAVTGARRLNVLVVDDNSVNRLIAARYVEGAGHEARMACDGVEAVEAVRDGAFDIVLMDINMPVLDGFGATRAIRAIDGPAAQIPIIALTANAMAEDRHRILEAGLDGYLCKPIRRDALIRSIEEARASARPDRARDRPAA